MPSVVQVLARPRKASRQSRPRSLRVPPLILRLVTWQRMSFSEPFLRNSDLARDLLESGAKRLRAPLEVGEHALPVALLVIRAPRIGVVHAVPQRVIEQ